MEVNLLGSHAMHSCFGLGQQLKHLQRALAQRFCQRSLLEQGPERVPVPVGWLLLEGLNLKM
jgi:hypothetical protein